MAKTPTRQMGALIPQQHLPDEKKTEEGGFEMQPLSSQEFNTRFTSPNNEKN